MVDRLQHHNAQTPAVVLLRAFRIWGVTLGVCGVSCQSDQFSVTTLWTGTALGLGCHPGQLDVCQGDEFVFLAAAAGLASLPADRYLSYLLAQNSSEQSKIITVIRTKPFRGTSEYFQVTYHKTSFICQFGLVILFFSPSEFLLEEQFWIPHEPLRTVLNRRVRGIKGHLKTPVYVPMMCKF